MNRRRFLAAAAGVGTTGVSAAAEEKEVLDWEKVSFVKEFTAYCQEATDGTYPNIRLEVSLAEKPMATHTPVVIRHFKLTWDDKQIPIEGRFWKDIENLQIETYPKAERKKLPPEKKYQLDAEMIKLKQPRIYLSADGGTVLIEWERGEDCDGHSSIRWIVSKNGIVLRHRHTPYHRCGI